MKHGRGTRGATPTSDVAGRDDAQGTPLPARPAASCHMAFYFFWTELLWYTSTKLRSSMDLYATRGVTLTTVAVDWPPLSEHYLGSTVHAFVVVIACYSCLCLVPKKKKKGERKNYCSGVFHVALNILEMKRSNFLDFFFFFFEAIQSEINKYMVILVCAYRLAVLELYEC